MDYADYLYNDLFKFDVSKLVPSECIQGMEAVFCEKWQKKLNSIYTELERKVHDEDLTSSLTAAVGY